MLIIPVKAPRIKKTIKFHPNNLNLGNRNIETDKIFYIPEKDLKQMKVGDIFRLKDLFNVRIKKINKEIKAEYFGDNLMPNTAKIQWTTADFIKMDIIIPKTLFRNNTFNSNSLEKIEGFAEYAVNKLKNDEIIQFERFGFVKIEKNKNKMIGYFTHK